MKQQLARLPSTFVQRIGILLVGIILICGFFFIPDKTSASYVGLFGITGILVATSMTKMPPKPYNEIYALIGVATGLIILTVVVCFYFSDPNKTYMVVAGLTLVVHSLSRRTW